MAVKQRKKTPYKKKIPEYDLGERLRFLRETRKLTQTSLADQAGISQATIAHIEVNSKDPSVDTLKKLAKALDVHIATLFTSDETFVFDLIRLRRKYQDANKLTPHLYMGLGKVIQFAKDIGYLK